VSYNSYVMLYNARLRLYTIFYDQDNKLCHLLYFPVA